MHEPEDVVVGINVAKVMLEVAVHPSGAARHLASDPAGMAEVVRWLQTVRPQLI